MSRYADALEERLAWERRGRGFHKPGPLFADVIEGGAPYWVSGEITGLLAEALPTFKPGDFAVGEPPSSGGFVLLEHPTPLRHFVEADIVDEVQGISAGIEGLFIHSFGWRSHPEIERVTVGVALWDERAKRFTLPLVYDLFDGLDWAGGSLNDVVPLAHGPLAFIRALWAFVKQPIASIAHARLDRVAVRRLPPEFRETDIRVIQLRRSESGHTSGGADRHYSARWFVRAHWRNQPCGPKGAERKPVMVVGHIKGPKDAPLKVRGIDVFAVVR